MLPDPPPLQNPLPLSSLQFLAVAYSAMGNNLYFDIAQGLTPCCMSCLNSDSIGCGKQLCWTLSRPPLDPLAWQDWSTATNATNA